MERRKGRSGSNRMIQINLNVRNRMILIHSVVKNNTLTRCTVLKTDIVWMRAVTIWMRSFSKENKSYKIYWEIVRLNHYRGTIKRVGQYKSRVLFQELQVSF